MARLPDYRAQRGLDIGSAQQLSADTSGLQRLDQFGRAVEKAGLVAVQFAQRNADLQSKRDNVDAEQRYNQLTPALKQDLEKVAADVPDSGSGLHDRFMSEAFDARATELIKVVPQDQRALFEKRLMQDRDLWSQQVARRERDQTYAHATQVIADSQSEALNTISSAVFDERMEQLFAVVEAAPLPSDMRARMTREIELSSRFETARKEAEAAPFDWLGATLK